MAKFDSVFKEKSVTKPQHPNKKIEWVHYTKLIRSEHQFYSEEQTGIEMLADMILSDGGVSQNIIIRKQDADIYEIIAGHRRTLACKYITEVLKIEGYAFMPAVITTVNEIKARFQVVSSNQYREKTSYEIMKEIEELKFLLENYPEEFEETKGRMVEKIANLSNMKKSTVGEYQSISKNLGSSAMEKFKEGEIDKSSAVELAGLSKEEQEELISKNVTSRSEIKAYKKEKTVPNVGTEIVKEDLFQVSYRVAGEVDSAVMNRKKVISLLQNPNVDMLNLEMIGRI